MNEPLRLNTAGNPEPYRLLYDLRWMELGQAGGIEQATYELVSAISRLDPQNSYRILAPRSACHEWDFPSDFKVGLHYADAGEAGIARTGALLDAGEIDLVHSSCGYIHPDLLKHRGILTVNDLQHRHYPQFFSREDWDDRENLYRSSVAAAHHIVCISEFTRQDVHRQYGVPLEKMTTAWIIPDRNAWQEMPAGQRQSILSAMGLNEAFFLFPAHCWPHKNHVRLVEAVFHAKSELPAGLKLVLTGRPFPADHPAAEMIRERGLESRIVHLGYRSPLEMRALFQGCQALVFPSLFEGFGMPVAEAIIARKPVLCSNSTSLPEIAGDAALAFDPCDPMEIAGKLVEVATQPGLRAHLVEASAKRRGIFSARRSAIRMLSVYRGVFEGMPRTGS